MNSQNFFFTTEIVSTFKYRGGEQFDFMGDDDVWVFVNRKPVYHTFLYDYHII